ncbi:MAG: GPW/gp25 family protein [Actinomycetota bacterium]|nr:GPW/gp25 family protein [Actinomycetota bacterium]
MPIDYPFHVDSGGRTARTTETEHIRDLIEQVLFTSPGERANRPAFGCGLMRLIFAPNSDELAAATEYLVQGALQQWLGDIIRVDEVEVSSEESTINVTVRFMMLKTRESMVEEYSREV